MDGYYYKKHDSAKNDLFSEKVDGLIDHIKYGNDCGKHKHEPEETAVAVFPDQVNYQCGNTHCTHHQAVASEISLDFIQHNEILLVRYSLKSDFFLDKRHILA